MWSHPHWTIASGLRSISHWVVWQR
jgi:hypothetical protein